VQNGPPLIVTDLPATAVAYPSAPLTLSVGVVGSEPITYAWYYNGAKLSDGGQISGSATAALTVSDFGTANVGNYELFATNAFGSANSTVCAVSLLSSVIGFNGFSGWNLLGVATEPSTNALQITDGGGGEVAASWFADPVYIGGFKASFYYWNQTGLNAADGTTFTIQNDPRGTQAIGAGGGSLGYGSANQITNSVNFEFNIYSGNAYGGIGCAFGMEGNVGDTFIPGAVSITDQTPIFTEATYLNGILSVTLTDTNSGATFTTNLPVNIPAIVGGETAYIGFTGGDGGVSSIQQVLNFSYTPIVGLSATKSGDTIVLSWPGSAGAYVLQQSGSVKGPFVNSTAPVTQANDVNSVTVTIGPGAEFFQLVLPAGH